MAIKGKSLAWKGRVCQDSQGDCLTIISYEEKKKKNLQKWESKQASHPWLLNHNSNPSCKATPSMLNTWLFGMLPIHSICPLFIANEME